MQWINILLTFFLVMLGGGSASCNIPQNSLVSIAPLLKITQLRIRTPEKQPEREYSAHHQKPVLIAIKVHNNPLQKTKGKYRCGAKRWKNRHYQYRLDKYQRAYLLIKNDIPACTNNYSLSPLEEVLASRHRSLYIIAPRA